MKYNNLRQEIDATQEKLKVFENSMYFNVEDITNILAELLTFCEMGLYYSVFQKRRLTALIRKSESAEKIVVFCIENTEDFENAWDVYSNYHGAISIFEMGDKPTEYESKIIEGHIEPCEIDITFKYLMDEYMNNNKNNFKYYCNDYFKNYDYVNDFIEYLYYLQVKNYGNHLTYKEMQVALKEFLNKEKGIEYKPEEYKKLIRRKTESEREQLDHYLHDGDRRNFLANF